MKSFSEGLRSIVLDSYIEPLVSRPFLECDFVVKAYGIGSRFVSGNAAARLIRIGAWYRADA